MYYFILPIFSIFSFEPFEGGEKNLLLSLQQNSELVGNIFLEKLFTVFNLWYTGKDNVQELDKVNLYFILFLCTYIMYVVFELINIYIIYIVGIF